MQKQSNFFEQNVQWFAVGLGGLFLAYMLYAYVLSSPVTAPVGSNPAAAPGEIDQLTLDGPVADLKRDIARSEVPEIPQKDYVQGFVAAIHGSTGAPVQLASSQIRSAPTRGGVFDQNSPQGPQDGPQKPVVALPTPPVAHVGSHTQGRSQVSWVDPEWVPRPGRPNDQPEPIVADKDWWSGEFIINGDELYAAFTKAFDVKRIEAVYPTAEPFFQTALVDVQLVRQEIGAGNKVVKEEVVKHLANQPLLVRPDFPAEDADPTIFGNYLNTVTQNPAELQNPPFYNVLAGDPWMEPGEATDALIAQMKEAGKEQRKQMKEQKRQEMLQKQAQLQAGRNVRAGAIVGEPMMEGDEGMMDAPAPIRPGFRPAPAPVAPGARRALAPGRPGAVRAFVPVSPVVLGAGKFAVTEGMGPIRIIAHDDTVQPGKSYRYKLRYKLFNPVYRGTAAAPELTKIFALKAADTAWTPKFTMRSKVEFFLAGTGREKATVDVFQFINGQIRKSSIQNVAPGDVITGTEWSLVDTGGTGDKAYALFTDDVGQVIRREPRADRESDRYDELNFEATLPPAVGINR